MRAKKPQLWPGGETTTVRKGCGMVKRKTAFGAAELVLGLLLAGMGVYTCIRPHAALGGVVALYGVGVIISGIADIILYIRLERWTGFAPVSSLVGGIVSLALGVLLIFNLRIGMLALSLIFPIWIILHCALRMVNMGLVRMNSSNAVYYLWMGLHIAGMLLGFLLLVNPFTSMTALGVIIACVLLLTGAAAIITGARTLASRKS